MKIIKSFHADQFRKTVTLGLLAFGIPMILSAKPLKVGPLMIRPHVDQTFDYSDNIFISNQNKVGDWSFNLRPGVQVSAGQTEALKLDVDYTFSKVWFLQRADQDNIGHNVTFSQSSVFNRSPFFSSLTSSFQTDANTLVGERVPSGNLGSNIGSIWRLTEKFTLYTFWNHQFNTFDDTRFIDNAQDVAGGSIGYSFDELTTFNVYGNYSRNQVNQGQDISGFAAGVGVNRVLNTTFSGFLNAGYTQNSFYNVFQGNQTFETANVTTGSSTVNVSRTAPGNDSQGATIGAGLTANTGKLTSTVSGTAFIGDAKDSAGGASSSFAFTTGANFSYAITTKTTASMNVYRTISQSVTEVNNTYYNTGVNINLSQKVTQKLTAAAFFGWNNVDFQDPIAVAGIGNTIRDDNLYSAGINFTYLIQEWLRVYGGYTYRENDSNISNFSFTENRVTLGIGASF
ncbi:outer membrane beta-barrel protein [Kamptonema cortianum]|nr:outer membrane beta-barrel protein [Kamptonema cortianum]